MAPANCNASALPDMTSSNDTQFGGGGGAHIGIGGDGGVGGVSLLLSVNCDFDNTGGLGARGFCDTFGLIIVGALSVGVGGRRLFPLQSGLSLLDWMRELIVLRLRTGAVPMLLVAVKLP